MNFNEIFMAYHVNFCKNLRFNYVHQMSQKFSFLQEISLVVLPVFFQNPVFFWVFLFEFLQKLLPEFLPRFFQKLFWNTSWNFLQNERNAHEILNTKKTIRDVQRKTSGSNPTEKLSRNTTKRNLCLNFGKICER